MSNRRYRSSLRALDAALKKRRNSLQRKDERKMFLETLERRELLAVGPQLIGIQPNNDALLRLDQTDIRQHGMDGERAGKGTFKKPFRNSGKNFKMKVWG